MNIFLKDLREACTHKLDAKRDFFSVDIDYYWTVAVNNNKKKPELRIGSLYDDWEWLSKLLRGETPLTLVNVERLGNVLQLLANETHDSIPKAASASRNLKSSFLKKLCLLVLSKLENMGLSSISYPEKLCWKIHQTSLCDFSKEPNVITVPTKSILDFLHENPTSANFENLGLTFKLLVEAIYLSDNLRTLFLSSK